MNKKILFGNNVGYQINNFIVKKKIIDFLFNNVDLYKLNYNIIKDEQDLLKIKNESYSLLPNIVGEDYIFIAIPIFD